MPAAERHYYDQHKFNPSKSSQHELEHNLMLQSQKKILSLAPRERCSYQFSSHIAVLYWVYK